MLIDFEKAYDSISFSSIQKCMKFFNFAVVNHSGNISQRMNIARGCRQGDPIASYLFIMSIEILPHKLRTEKKVEGFQIEQESHKLELFADDCSIFFNPKSENLRNSMNMLTDFYNLSGL